MSVKIISDSCCDLPKEIVEELDIEILPIIVIKDDKEYRDGVDISVKTVYEEMRKGANYKTAQIPPMTFHESFKKHANENNDAIYIAFSSQLSATHQVSEMVALEIREKNPEFNLHIVDSLAASGGFGLIVLEAAKLAKKGASAKEILELIDFYKENTDHIFTVDNIDYLYRGGRVSRTSAVIGGMLNIKPILDVENGKLIPIEKVHGRNKCLRRMVDMIGERAIDKDLSDRTFVITHGDDLETAERVKDMITEKYGAKEFIINYIGSAIGAHSGPGTIALFYTLKSYK